MLKQLFLLLCLTYFPTTLWTQLPLKEISWSKNKTIGSPISYSSDIAINNAGSAVSVFLTSDGSNQRVKASILTLGRYWIPMDYFFSFPGIDAEVPKVAISPNDDEIFVVWKEHSNSQYVVQAAIFDMDNKQGLNICDLTGPVNLGADPIIGVDSKGNALIVWSVFDGEMYHIQSAMHYNNLSYFQKNQWIRLNEIIVNGAFELDLDFDREGKAIIVWEGLIGFKNVIQGAILQCGAHKWVRTEDLSPSNTQASFPKVGLDGKGNAIAIWSEGVALSHIAAAKLPFGSVNWVTTSNPTSSKPSNFSDLAVDSSGNAVAIWVAFEDPSKTHVEVSTLNRESLIWADPIRLTSSLTITEPKVAVDKHGNAVAIWSASGVLQTSFLPLGGSWKAPWTITPPTIGVGEQCIAMNTSGFAIITYTAQIFESSQEVVQAVYGKH